jgi:hypothetical protein
MSSKTLTETEAARTAVSRSAVDLDDEWALLDALGLV